MIYILTTGGTIEGIDDDKQINGHHDGTTSIKKLLEAANVSFQYTIEEVLRVDSRAITDTDREHLANKIKATQSNKILITHGTFTMEDTAKYIGNLNLKKTIVLTGSFILGSHVQTDASFNLGYAISSLQFLKPDVYVAMNGKVFHWKDVTKNLESKKFQCKND